MVVELREYQLEAVESILHEFETGVHRQLIVLPTGSGKTIVMAAIAKALNKKTLLIAHRQELIDQAAEKIPLIWPDVSIGICMGDRDEVDQQIIVGSVQSCCRPRRLERLKEQGFDLLMIDEAHHSAADTYQSIINNLGFQQDSKKLLLGVTATPQRSDKIGLGETFQKVTFSRSIATMIRGGYLAPVIGRKILTNLNLERIRTQNGDFALDELSEAVNTPERNNFIVNRYKEYAADRKGIAFCVDVQHCKDLAAAFKAKGIASEAVFGDMEPLGRKTALEALKHGKIQVATSCGVLTEGFDEPSISAIVMGRPTKSQSLYIQCAGRGLRLHPSKQSCLVLDFTDRGHNLDSVLNLSSVIPEVQLIDEQVTDEEKEKEEIDRTPKICIVQTTDQEFDILGCARFIWIPIGNGEWSLLDDDKKEIIMRPEGGGYVATLYNSDGSSFQIVKKAIPLDYCSGVCEDFARKNLRIEFADVKASWMSRPAPATQGQKNYLEKKGAYREGMSKAEASLEIRKIIAMQNKQRRAMASEPPTFKQLFALKNMGIKTEGMNKHDAWKRLASLKSDANTFNAVRESK